MKNNDSGGIEMENEVEIKRYWETKESTEHFKWLKSIRLCAKNGYMSDEDCHRVQEYFATRSKPVQGDLDIDKALDAIISDRYEGTVEEAYKAIIEDIQKLRKHLSLGTPSNGLVELSKEYRDEIKHNFKDALMDFIAETNKTGNDSERYAEAFVKYLYWRFGTRKDELNKKKVLEIIKSCGVKYGNSVLISSINFIELAKAICQAYRSGKI